MNNIPVSFIIPCFNCDSTLSASINSIVSCDLANYEICLVNDGSTDSTAAVLDYWKKKLNNVINVTSNEKNMGGAFTRNKCVSLTKNKLLFCLDSDNIVIKDSIQKCLTSIRDADDLVSFGGIDFFYEFYGINLHYKSWRYLREVMLFEDLRKTQSTPVASGNYFFTRNAYNSVNGYDEDVGALDAYSLGYKLLLKGYKFKLVPGTTYLHRLHPNSYWIRESDKNNNNFRKLLLRYPSEFSPQEIDAITNSSSVMSVLTNGSNDFTSEHTNPLLSSVSSLLKVLKINRT